MENYEVPRSKLPALPVSPPPRPPVGRSVAPSQSEAESHYEQLYYANSNLKRDQKKTPHCRNFCIFLIVITLILISLFAFSIIKTTFFKKPLNCDTGYIGLVETGFCYKVVTLSKKSTFDDGDEYCKAENGELASIHSKEENQWLADLSRKSNTTLPYTEYINRLNEQDEVIIGLNYDNGKWQWTDGTPVDFTNWSYGEPNRMDFEWTVTIVTSKIGKINPHGRLWNNIPTQSAQRAFICKKGGGSD